MGSTITAASQNSAAIRGHVNGAQGYTVRIFIKDDLISGFERKIASCPIDHNGNFNVLVKADLYTYAYIDIGNVRSGILLESGKQYNVVCDQYPPLPSHETRNLFLQKESLALKIDENSSGDTINKTIEHIDADFNRFLANHYIDIYKKRLNVVDSFIDSFFLKYGTLTHPFLRDMVDYKIAMLRLASFKITTEQVYEIWFKDKDILYHHPDFMEFFNQAFSNYLPSGFKKYTYQELQYTINNKGSYFALSELLGRDSVLRNEQFRELVMLKGLEDVYHKQGYDKSKIIKIWRFVSTNSKFVEHRIIALNLIVIKSQFDTGKPAPNFTLRDTSGTKITLNDFQGKYLYLMFFTGNCLPCLSEMTMLKSYYDNININIEVLAIGLDPIPDKMFKSISSYDFPWQIVNFNLDFDLTDQYRIRNYPFFILINPNGTIHTYNARPPSNQFKEWFEDVVLKK